MQVLLLKTIPGLGRSGEIKEASDGYARNFLIPRRWAEPVTKQGQIIIEAKKKKQARLQAEYKKNRTKLARRLIGKSFILNAKADTSGTLYAGVNAAEVAAILVTAGFAVDAKEVMLAEHIKKIGVYNVELEIGGEKIAIKLEIRS